MRETWYVLEDGSVVDPRECALNEGRLTHKGGVAVEMRGETPRSRGVDVDEEPAKAPAKAKESAGYDNRELKAAKPRGGYKTRKA